MLKAVDKGIEAAEVATPPVGVYHGVDLRVLPKYVAFRAAMLKERLTLQYLSAVLAALLVANFTFSRFEVITLEKRLREKEYILAPGVVDFTPASPETVSDSYVASAAMSFLSELGNVNANNVEEQYRQLEASMAPELAVQFEAEAREWIGTVKNENLSEVLRILDREIVAGAGGFYRVTAVASRERYANGESVGHEDEVIEMTLKLVPPERGKAWFLEIVALKRSKADGVKHEEKKRGGKA
ncbi:hypothetical protein FACS1894126_1370 [Alphaproteobacteria bacterium]|jgi:hypothetical protein|nr:hypothetical protein FACS1894126_1370 [Alphaproteobacteria bacterium]